MIRLWRVALVVFLALHVSLAGAQQDDATLAASARTLFEEGVQLADRGEWPGAADRFRRALALRDSHVIRFNLAAALAELGQVVEASELFRQLVRTEGVEPALKAQAEQRLAQTTARIGKLTLQVEGKVEGARVELDGRALPAALIGVATPVDPGTHTARLLQGEAELDTEQVDVAPGASAALTLHVKRAPTPEQTAAAGMGKADGESMLSPAGQDAERRDEPNEGRRKKLLWWGVGAGAVAVVAAAVIAGVLLSQDTKQESPYRGDFEPGSVAVRVLP